MIVKNYDESVLINHNSNWPDHPYRILIIGSSGSGKTKVLLNLIKHQQPGIDKIYLYVKNPFKSKYILLRNRREKVGIKKILKSNTTYWLLKSKWCLWQFRRLQSNKESESVNSVWWNDIEANKKLSSIVTEVFLWGKKLNISLGFILQRYLNLPKTIRLNATHYFIIEIPDKREIQQLASSYAFDNEFKDFMKIYKGYTKEPY